MFQAISWGLLIAIFIGILIHYISSLDAEEQTKAKSAKKKSPLWWCGWEKDLGCLSKLKRIAAVVAVSCLMVMAVTAFSGRLAADELMSGYALMLHVGSAPVFIGCVVFLLITWAHQCRLTRAEWEELTKRIRFQSVKAKGSGLFRKLTFWSAMFLTVPASLSIVSVMFTLFGTHEQEVLFQVHQYTSLALVSFAIVHIYLVLRHQSK
jgi:hypothetical protein